MGKYFNMNEIEIGTKLKIKKDNRVGELKAIFHYPTTFKIEFEDGSFDIYKTNQIELIKEDSD